MQGLGSRVRGQGTLDPEPFPNKILTLGPLRPILSRVHGVIDGSEG